MTLDEARALIGDGVVYRPRRPHPDGASGEKGVIVRAGDVFVFVDYGRGGAEATCPEDLTLTTGTAATAGED